MTLFEKADAICAPVVFTINPAYAAKSTLSNRINRHFR